MKTNLFFKTQYFIFILLFSNLSLNAQKIHRDKYDKHDNGRYEKHDHDRYDKHDKIGNGNWTLLGITEADHKADHDAIHVSGRRDYYRKLKFKVLNADLTMKRMIVIYDDGGKPENINVRTNIPQGGESREIDLQGGKRRIKSVQFWYESKGIFKGKAKLTLFGKK